MTDSIRCPACRGAKKVPKLGGMIGECNKCEGKGTILASDKPVKIEAVTVEVVCAKELINSVANAVSVSDSDCFIVPTGIDQPALSNIEHKASIKTLPDVKIEAVTVADCVPATSVTITSDIVLPGSDRIVIDSIKIDGKKALYKRKKA